jgi:hypothetical protein
MFLRKNLRLFAAASSFFKHENLYQQVYYIHNY